jgi:hypothetical protein
MKVWITKHALTSGIIETTVNKSDVSGIFLSYCNKQGYWEFCFKSFWHTSREDAIKHAEIMRERKLASLHKAIHRIAGLQF